VTVTSYIIISLIFEIAISEILWPVIIFFGGSSGDLGFQVIVFPELLGGEGSTVLCFLAFFFLLFLEGGGIETC
jgi:hypothetical protein